ncbi:EAL domain-containing protein [Pseudorhodoplanes sp.]|uniref:EAL domain-containing protein n=1 Tax=Pseudorhodoplanes sp. TaxID=1934341 RepID=UPI00391CA68C
MSGMFMQRLTAIFIAICVVLIAASIGAVGYLLFRLSGTEAALLALAVMTVLALYNMMSARLRDRDRVGGQIADLSRGTADLARQVAEIGRKLNAIEAQEVPRHVRMQNDALAAEIGELGGLVKELAETVAAHDLKLKEIGNAAAPVMLRGAAPVEPSIGAEPRVATPLAPEPAAVQPVAAQPVSAQPSAAQPVAALPAAAIPGHPEKQRAQEPQATGPLKGKTTAEIAALISGAIEDNRIDLYLQPVVTLPQRKVRYYEAMTRLRMEDGTLILPSDFLPHAERAGLVPKIDNMQLFRCVQVLRRLQLKNRDIGLFCNVSVATLNDAEIFRQFFDFLEANRALSGSLMLEFGQSALRELGPIEQESLAALIALGYRFSMDHVTDLRMGPRDLSDLGVRFVKVPAQLLLDKGPVAADIHAADLSDLLGRHGISLIAERIETEVAVVDLLDFDVRFGQGFLFSPPRPVRADALLGAAAAMAERPMAESVLGAAARAAI